MYRHSSSYKIGYLLVNVVIVHVLEHHERLLLGRILIRHALESDDRHV